MYIKILITSLFFVFLNSNICAQDSVQVFSIKQRKINSLNNNFISEWQEKVFSLKTILQQKLDPLKNIYTTRLGSCLVEVTSNIEDVVFNGKNRFLIKVSITVDP
jgi:hypothetical protein